MRRESESEGERKGGGGGGGGGWLLTFRGLHIGALLLAGAVPHCEGISASLRVLHHSVRSSCNCLYSWADELSLGSPNAGALDSAFVECRIDLWLFLLFGAFSGVSSNSGLSDAPVDG